MFLCLSITFISSISEIRSARSLSVASSEVEMNLVQKSVLLAQYFVIVSLVLYL